VNDLSLSLIAAEYFESTQKELLMNCLESSKWIFFSSQQLHILYLEHIHLASVHLQLNGNNKFSIFLKNSFMKEKKKEQEKRERCH
jgi:ABC-type microcin C transport system permease subunit YejB